MTRGEDEGWREDHGLAALSPAHPCTNQGSRSTCILVSTLEDEGGEGMNDEDDMKNEEEWLYRQ